MTSYTGCVSCGMQQRRQRNGVSSGARRAAYLRHQTLRLNLLLRFHQNRDASPAAATAMAADGGGRRKAAGVCQAAWAAGNDGKLGGGVTSPLVSSGMNDADI